jgi:hypothetical protein
MSGAGGLVAEPVRARRLTDEEGPASAADHAAEKYRSVRVRPAMIIMASASGTLVPAIARLVAADEDTVQDVIHPPTPCSNRRKSRRHRPSR